MKINAITRSQRYGIDRVTTRIPACLLALVIAGCAAPKDQYAASADAQQRMAAEAAADTKAGTSVDTRETYLKLVEQMQRENLWFASLAHIDALEQRWGISPESTRLRADALRQTGQAAQSETAYKRLMGTPLEGAGYRGLGLLAGARGNYPEAVQLLKQAQRHTPTDALLLSDLGYAQLRAGSTDDARLPLMQALQLRPDSTQAQANLALYLELSNQPEQAAAMMDANRMSAAARSAIKDAAQQLRNGASATSTPPATAGNSVRDEAAPPLALKASRWSALTGVRTAIQVNPAATSASAPLSPISTPQGTP
ncbi:Tetratricopeptide repeat protein [Variovorax boronicumulans]|uniref:tetratricopeptide repeat protein n=1 Tax=Variovorax boronicumulans TaxID=436515 RepID=UPI00209C0876|nr:tetratricopeptide repeat protein [Variovorax boronicumulans]PBI92259.1 Tetratricopeptide repeat protein [Variovorax boronicumulans]